MIPLDDEIREHFADLSAEDSARAPRFSTLWVRAERDVAAARRTSIVRRSWLAVAAIIVAAPVVMQAWRRHEAGAPVVHDPAAYPSILAWKAPTDGLLETAPRAVGASPSTFGSMLDAPSTDSVLLTARE